MSKWVGHSPVKMGGMDIHSPIKMANIAYTTSSIRHKASYRCYIKERKPFSLVDHNTQMAEAMSACIMNFSSKIKSNYRFILHPL